MKNLIYIIAILFFAITPDITFAHGDEDHGATNETPAINQQNYFATETASDKYELLLRYEPIKAGTDAHLILFISEFETNKPVNNAEIKITSPEDANINFTASQMGEGKYNIDTEFPENKIYSLAVSVNSPHGADLLLLQNVEIGKELPIKEDHPGSIFGNWQIWLIIFLAIVFGLGLGLLLPKRNVQKGRQVTSVLLLLIYCLIPVTNTIAHGDEDHGAATTPGTNFSNSFYVPKETQFLFEVITEKLKRSRFSESTVLFGTIIPGSSGHAVVSVPQSGRIVSLNVKVGQNVKAGQQLAVVEQTLDAGTQVGFLSERNNLIAEYEAAKKEYGRLNSIRDIAAKRDVDEAEARLKRAENNLKLFSGSSGRTTTLNAPVSGVVGNFNLSIGSTVNAGETLFTVTDLSTVYIEAQVFAKDIDKLRQATKFTIENKDDKSTSADVKLISMGQELNATNQSQRVLFELINKDENFMIGEFVNIRVFGPVESMQLVLPNSAFTEINGRPVVYIKEAAENYSVSYVETGNNNGTHTTIIKGAEEGERIVINAAYQLQMVYLNP